MLRNWNTDDTDWADFHGFFYEIQNEIRENQPNLCHPCSNCLTFKII
jgi:hypothetical protein